MHCLCLSQFCYSLLFWTEAKISSNLVEDWTAVSAISLIFQANMDGTSLEVVVEGISELASFAIDRESSRLYWTYSDGAVIWEYDIDVRKTRHLTYGSMTSELHVHFASGGTIYVQEYSGQAIYRGYADDGSNLTEVCRFGKGLAEGPYVIATPRTESKAKLVENPCLNHNCSHLCALSGPGRAGCVCEPGFGLSLDGLTCMGTT